eukprot:TRINITY_DN10031_c0_g1_i1.p1 TRINITY_DN10031_c0_g1~~TRINITY_DN10031_c0_g1_i1.p1  ORF type:complete len:454 (+),score=55.64 TRINITY_DN10031_c0_g1_i1:48-1409(+)
MLADWQCSGLKKPSRIIAVALLASGGAQLYPNVEIELAETGPVGIELAQTAPVGIELAETGPITFTMEDVRPIGLEDIASVFPAAGPFGDDSRRDPFIHEFMQEIDPAFIEQLVPVIQSRYPDASHPCLKDVATYCHDADSTLHCLGIHSAQLSAACKEEIKNSVPYVCSDEIQKHCDGARGSVIMPCLEVHGHALGQDCVDSIIAARQTLSSIKASQKRAEATRSGKAEANVQPHPGSAHCPPHWEGPKAGGCCTRRWSPTCNLQCSVDDCNRAEGGWKFKWADFRTHPYICCPSKKDEVSASQHLGGQPICPSGWEVEERGHGHCCRKPWSWDCGEHCALENCKSNVGMAWHPVDDSKESYKCCPEIEDPEAIGEIRKVHETVNHVTNDEAVDDVLSVGSNWVAKPLDISRLGISSAGAAAGGAVVFLCALYCCCCGTAGRQHKLANHKHH